MSDLKKITLHVIPEPQQNTRAILKFENEAKIDGPRSGNTNLYCGNCSKLLAEKLEEKMILNIVIRCACGSFNEIPSNWGRFILTDIQEKSNLALVVAGLILLLVGEIVSKTIGIILIIVGFVIEKYKSRAIKIFKDQRDTQ